MSGRLVSIVFDSALPAWLKPYAAACASFAAEDGTRVYPTIARVARMVGRGERATQTAMLELRRRGVLTVLRKGGRHQGATRYRLSVAALPGCEPAQLPLFPQATPHQFPARAVAAERFPQVLTGFNRQSATGQPEAHCTRSVSDPSSTTHPFARAREKANARKTGT
jgi:hypothetical protein